MSKKKEKDNVSKTKKLSSMAGNLYDSRLLILASPIYTNQKVDIPDEVSTNAF